MKVCIAGQNNIAISFTEYILKKYKNIELFACPNKSDNGLNNFHRSFLSFCKLNNIKIKELKDLYFEENLIFLSLEFDQIICIDKFKSNNLFNLHFSLLPEYKGMYTSALPILHDKTYSGVTLHKIDNGIDTGDILFQKKINIKNLNCEELYNLYTKEGLLLLIENFDKVLKNKFQLKRQQLENSTYFSKKSIDYSNIKINLNKTASQIKNQLLAFTFPFKQIPTIFDKKIIKSEILNKKSKGRVGEVIVEDEFYQIINTIDYNLKIHFYKNDEILFYAMKGDVNKIKLFAEKYHNIYEKNKKGWDALIVAAFNGHFELVKYLIEILNWDINTSNINGTTLLMYTYSYSILNNNFDIFNYVIKLDNINILQRDYYGKDIFDYANEENNSKILEILQNHK